MVVSHDREPLKQLCIKIVETEQSQEVLPQALPAGLSREPCPALILSLYPAGYLKQQSLPMVVVSHDREFLDQLCTKIVETEQGVSSSYAGTYTEFMAEKEARLATQWSAWEKQQKEIARQVCLTSAW